MFFEVNKIIDFESFFLKQLNLSKCFSRNSSLEICIQNTHDPTNEIDH